MAKGGARKGAGRKPTGTGGPIWVAKEAHDRIAAAARERGIPPGQVIAELALAHLPPAPKSDAPA